MISGKEAQTHRWGPEVATAKALSLAGAGLIVVVIYYAGYSSTFDMSTDESVVTLMRLSAQRDDSHRRLGADRLLFPLVTAMSTNTTWEGMVWWSRSVDARRIAGRELAMSTASEIRCGDH